MRKKWHFKVSFYGCNVGLFVAIVAILVCAGSVYGEGFNRDGLHYEINPGGDKTCTVTTWWSSVSKFPNLEIPSIVTDEKSGQTYIVTGIGWEAFRDCEHIEGVVIPESVIEIGSNAFINCQNLKTAVVPRTVKSLPEGCFSDCSSLRSVTLYSGTKEIGARSFAGCTSLTNVPLPEGLVGIGNNAFEGCKSLASLRFPASLREIGDYAFKDCSQLDGIILPGFMTEIPEGIFSGCASLSSIDIPESVTLIKAYAFNGCTGLRYVSLPKFVTEIGVRAFYKCEQLESIDIPESVDKLGCGAFEECRRIKSVVIPDSVTVLEMFMFNSCESLESVTLPNGIIRIDTFAFMGCPLKMITLPSTLQIIGEGALWCNFNDGLYVISSEPPRFDYEDAHRLPHSPGTVSAFSPYVRNNVTLYIPVGSLEAYSTAYEWKDFKNIVEKDYASVSDVYDSEPGIEFVDGKIVINGLSPDTNVEICDLSGRIVYSGKGESISGLGDGVYIVRAGNLTKKIMIKGLL